jgi:hypothetical protein
MPGANKTRCLLPATRDYKFRVYTSGINDDAELDINEITIGIAKECWPARIAPRPGSVDFW